MAVSAVKTTRTIESFEDLVGVIRELGCRWYDSRERGIRTRGLRNGEKKQKPRFCPLTAVCYYLTGTYFGEAKWRLAAEHIGLSYAIARSVQSAADNERTDDSYVAYVRSILLRECGIAGV